MTFLMRAAFPENVVKRFSNVHEKRTRGKAQACQVIDYRKQVMGMEHR